MPAHAHYIIELGDIAVGLAMQGEGEFLFHAVHPAVQRLHGKRFPDMVAARRAALKSLSQCGIEEGRTSRSPLFSHMG